jgi:hypothetical protein
VELAGARTTVHLFFMRSCFSGAAFSMASPVETQQAFLGGHAEAFGWFGGVHAHKRELVAALVARYVDPYTERGMRELASLLDEHRSRVAGQVDAQQ